MEKVITLDELSKLSIYSYFDGYLLVIKKFSAFHFNQMNKKDTITAIKIIHDLGKKAYLLIDRIFFNDELKELKKFILELNKYHPDGYFFSDIGVLQLLLDLKLNDKGIYYSQTNIVSSLELSAFNDFNLKCIFVSKDYNYQNLIKNLPIINNIGVNIFGYRNLFYSRRLLLSSYKEEYKLKDRLSNSNKYLIKEQTRETKSIIYEDKYGTYVFTDYIDNHLNEMFDLTDAGVSMLLFDDNFIEEENINRLLNFLQNPEKKYQLQGKEKDTYEE